MLEKEKDLDGGQRCSSPHHETFHMERFDAFDLVNPESVTSIFKFFCHKFATCVFLNGALILVFVSPPNTPLLSLRGLFPLGMLSLRGC